MINVCNLFCLEIIVKYEKRSQLESINHIALTL